MSINIAQLFIFILILRIAWPKYHQGNDNDFIHFLNMRHRKYNGHGDYWS